MSHQKTTKAEVDELGRALAEVDELRARLAEIGAYAAERGTRYAGHSVTGREFQQIARLARAATA